MEAYVLDWLSLLGRWLHLVAGVAWIGASFYFVWLDNHLLPLPDAEKDEPRNRGVSGHLWAVHGGGFYNARKLPLGPETLPEPLHWFKWEAYTTWLSGFFLLCVVYYAKAGTWLIDPQVAAMSPAVAIFLGVLTLVLGWVVYDLLCRSPLRYNELHLAVVLAVFLTIMAWALCKVFSGRGAYLHFGAMLATIMAANVFFVIMPGQRELVAARRDGHEVDPRAARRAKQRSVHNTYFTLPVLFTMISNHYALTYGARGNWLVLIALCAAGALIRTWFVARHKAHAGQPASPWTLVAGLAVLAGVIIALRPDAPARTAAAGFPRIQAIVAQRCAACHAERPTQEGFSAAPKGVMLDTPERMRAQAQLMRAQLQTKAMPIGNLTQMTEDERAAVIGWIDAGARAE